MANPFTPSTPSTPLANRLPRSPLVPGEPLEPLLRRIEGEYLEMPGLQLTRDQAERLWAVDRATCIAVLDALIQRRFLTCGADHRYRRSTDGTLSQHRLTA